MRYYEDIEINEVEEHGKYDVTKEEIKEFARKYDPQRSTWTKRLRRSRSSVNWSRLVGTPPRS